MEEGGGIRSDKWHKETAILIERLQQPFGSDQQEAVFELLERTVEEPMACAEHLSVLLDFCESNNEGARWAAAAAIGNIVEREPRVATSYIDRLVAILDDESEVIRESVSSALTHVEPPLEVPVLPLVSILERGDESAAEAVDVMSNIVTKRPSAFPTSRLERMANTDEEIVRSGARYLLTLLAAVGQCESPYTPTQKGYYEFSKAIPDGLPSGKSNQFVFNVVQQRAIDLFLSTELTFAGYHGMDFAKTPRGRKLILRVEDPSAVDETYGDPVKLASELSERFGIQKPKIDLQRISDENAVKDHRENERESGPEREESDVSVQSADEPESAAETETDSVESLENRPTEETQNSSASAKSASAAETTQETTSTRSRLCSQSIPDTIPTVPQLSIEYDALSRGDPLGSGGNADVYHATVSTPHEVFEVAVKEPRMAGTLHVETVDRLLNEAETWKQLDDHDHIVGIIDYGSKPLPWIVMEYMDGGHVGNRAGELEFEQALWTAITTTKAVRHAHRRGVAHLDLKPENILFHSVDDGWDVPKVADWGLSKHLLDHSKSVDGFSPHYAAPEQFDESHGAVDDVTDVYQLGTVFYELFTGRPPFKGTPVRVMHKVMNETPTPPSEVADLPTALDNLILTAMATERDERYESVLYLRDDLQELSDQL